MKIPNTNKMKSLTPVQRQRRIRKQLRQKHARHTRALNQLSNPCAVVALVTGDVPHHLQMPTTMRGIRRLVDELNAIHFCFTSDDAPDQSHSEKVRQEPVLPRLLRPTTKPFEPVDGDLTGLLRLESGHMISPADLVSWSSQGQLRVPYYIHRHPDKPRPDGECALVYHAELQMMLPGVNLNGGWRRAIYWVGVMRDNAGHASEIRVHSQSLKPLFRLAIGVHDPAQVMDADLAAWWTGANR